MSFKNGACLLIFLILSACATTKYEDTTKDTGGYQFGSASFRSQENGIFVLLKKINGRWRLIAKSYNPDYIAQAYKDVQSDLFLINTQTRYITYFYYNKGSFSGGFLPAPISQELNCRYRNVLYTSLCQSSFVSRTGMGMLQSVMSFGTDSTKQFDTKAAYTALNDAGTFEKLNAHVEGCSKTKKILNAYINKKVIVKPIVKDKTGFYTGKNIFSVTKDYTLNHQCDLRKAVITIKTSINDDSYRASPGTTENTIRFNNKVQYVKPEFTLYGKKFDPGFKNPVTKNDKYLHVKIERVRKDKYSDLYIDFNLSNISKSYLNINKISFYANGTIITNSLSRTISLPPNAEHKYVMKINDQNITSLFRDNITKKEAMQMKLRLGFSILYSINSKSKTLYAKRTVPYINGFKIRN